MTREKPGLELSVDRDGIAHMVFDRGEEGLNILDLPVMERLEIGTKIAVQFSDDDDRLIAEEITEFST